MKIWWYKHKREFEKTRNTKKESVYVSECD